MGTRGGQRSLCRVVRPLHSPQPPWDWCPAEALAAIQSWTTDSTLCFHRGFPRPSRSADGETDVILFAPASALFSTGGAPRGMPDDLAATFFHRSPVTSALLVAAADIYLHLLRKRRAWPPLGPLRDRLGWLVCGY